MLRCAIINSNRRDTNTTGMSEGSAGGMASSSAVPKQRVVRAKGPGAGAPAVASKSGGLVVPAAFDSGNEALVASGSDAGVNLSMDIYNDSCATLSGMLNYRGSGVRDGKLVSRLRIPPTTLSGSVVVFHDETIATTSVRYPSSYVGDAMTELARQLSGKNVAIEFSTKGSPDGTFGGASAATIARNYGTLTYMGNGLAALTHQSDGSTRYFVTSKLLSITALDKATLALLDERCRIALELAPGVARQGDRRFMTRYAASGFQARFTHVIVLPTDPNHTAPEVDGDGSSARDASKAASVRHLWTNLVVHLNAVDEPTPPLALLTIHPEESYIDQVRVNNPNYEATRALAVDSNDDRATLTRQPAAPIVPSKTASFQLRNVPSMQPMTETTIDYSRFPLVDAHKLYRTKHIAVQTVDGSHKSAAQYGPWGLTDVELTWLGGTLGIVDQAIAPQAALPPGPVVVMVKSPGSGAIVEEISGGTLTPELLDMSTLYSASKPRYVLLKRGDPAVRLRWTPAQVSRVVEDPGSAKESSGGRGTFNLALKNTTDYHKHARVLLTFPVAFSEMHVAAKRVDGGGDEIVFKRCSGNASACDHVPPGKQLFEGVFHLDGNVPDALEYQVTFSFFD